MKNFAGLCLISALLTHVVASDATTLGATSLAYDAASNTFKYDNTEFDALAGLGGSQQTVSYLLTFDRGNATNFPSIGTSGVRFDGIVEVSFQPGRHSIPTLASANFYTIDSTGRTAFASNIFSGPVTSTTDFSFSFSAALLPSQGLTPSNYLFDVATEALPLDFYNNISNAAWAQGVSFLSPTSLAISPVPEAGTALLMMFGLTSMAGIRKGARH